jgi:hypothetical protein
VRRLDYVMARRIDHLQKTTNNKDRRSRGKQHQHQTLVFLCQSNRKEEGREGRERKASEGCAGEKEKVRVRVRWWRSLEGDEEGGRAVEEGGGGKRREKEASNAEALPDRVLALWAR